MHLLSLVNEFRLAIRAARMFGKLAHACASSGVRMPLMTSSYHIFPLLSWSRRMKMGRPRTECFLPLTCLFLLGNLPHSKKNDHACALAAGAPCRAKARAMTQLGLARIKFGKRVTFGIPSVARN